MKTIALILSCLLAFAQVALAGHPATGYPVTTSIDTGKSVDVIVSTSVRPVGLAPVTIVDDHPANLYGRSANSTTQPTSVNPVNDRNPVFNRYFSRTRPRRLRLTGTWEVPPILRTNGLAYLHYRC